MKRRSAFETYLRTGRRVTEPEEVETKFNPWHDPEDGRFTFAGQGRNYGGGQSRNAPAPKRSVSAVPRAAPATRITTVPSQPEGTRASEPAQLPVMRAMGLPVDNGPQPTRSPQRQAAAKPKIRPLRVRATATVLKPIRGYPETAASSWPKANDQVFTLAANRFNAQRGLKPGDPRYLDPQLFKAWATVESGGSKSAFLRDPFQVNNPGDFKSPKPEVTGLTMYQPMTPEISAEAALKWLEFRGYVRDKQHRPGPWLGFEGALRRYNARRDRHPSGLPHSVWYAREVLKLYEEAKKSR